MRSAEHLGRMGSDPDLLKWPWPRIRIAKEATRTQHKPRPIPQSTPPLSATTPSPEAKTETHPLKPRTRGSSPGQTHGSLRHPPPPSSARKPVLRLGARHTPPSPRTPSAALPMTPPSAERPENPSPRSRLSDTVPTTTPFPSASVHIPAPSPHKTRTADHNTSSPDTAESVPPISPPRHDHATEGPPPSPSSRPHCLRPQTPAVHRRPTPQRASAPTPSRQNSLLPRPETYVPEPTGSPPTPPSLQPLSSTPCSTDRASPACPSQTHRHGSTPLPAASQLPPRAGTPASQSPARLPCYQQPAPALAPAPRRTPASAQTAASSPLLRPAPLREFAVLTAFHPALRPELPAPSHQSAYCLYYLRWKQRHSATERPPNDHQARHHYGQLRR